MRALTAAVVTVVILCLAATTYFSVGQDPLGGEPKVEISIAPPDLDKLQPTAAVAPADGGSGEAVVVQPQPAAAPQTAETTAGAAAPAAAPAPAPASSPEPYIVPETEGVSVTVPEN